jgi:hypothetical protein
MAFFNHDSDPVKPQNHYTKLELLEFNRLTKVWNSAVFYNSKAEEVILSCTLTKEKLRIDVVEKVEGELKTRSQYIAMEDCENKLQNSVVSMLQSEEPKLLRISFDFEDRLTKTKFYKFELSPNQDLNLYRAYLKNKVEMTLQRMNL